MRDTDGGATGALKEAAVAIVEQVVPQPGREEKLDALRKRLKEAQRVGLTSVVNATGSPEELELYAELERRGQLTVRTYTALNLRPGMTVRDFAAFEQARRRYRSPWVRAGVVKGFVDGVIESHTAAMIEPYADDPGLQGALNYSPDELARLVRELDRRGFQVMLHAIGDRAVRTALDAFEAAAKANGDRDRRFRIEHIETIAGEDIPRFARLRVVASFQPYHAYPDENLLSVWARNVGAQRVNRAFAWRQIAESGGRLAFGSDWPVVTLNPFVGIQNALL